MINVNFFKRTMKHHSILLVNRIHFAKLFKKYYLLGKKKTMYHIWKISKIISSETRGNKQAEMKPKVAKRITTSQPHPTTLPPPANPNSIP